MTPDYSRFKFRAEIDWVELLVRLPRPSQPQHVRNRIAAALPHWGTPPYVTAETENPSRTATEFAFRLQNPVGPDALLHDVQALVRHGDPELTASDVRIVGIEVAVDAYNQGSHNRSALVDLAHHFMVHHGLVPEEHHLARVCGPDGGEIAYGRAEFRRGIGQGHTVNMGHVKADHRTRYYVKDRDTRNGQSYAPLPPALHRARMEVVLAGALVPFRTIEQWREFRFETLARWFALRRFTPAATPLGQVIQDVSRAGLPGSKVEAARRAHDRTTKANTRADSVAAERVRQALKGLTRAQSRGASRA